MSTADANKPKEKNLTCNVCGLVFESEQTLHEHMKKDHSQEAAAASRCNLMSVIWRL